MLTFLDLENEIQTNQVSPFIQHLKDEIIQDDKNGFSFSVSDFLIKYQLLYPQFFIQFSKILEKSVQKNDSQLLYLFGVCFYYAIGLKKNIQQAFSYFSSAAQLGYARALSSLGFFYLTGEGVSKDLKKSN